MIELEQLSLEFSKFKEPLMEIGQSLDLENKERRIDELEKVMEAGDFWDDMKKAQGLMKELNSLKATRDKYKDLANDYEDTETLLELANEEDDESLFNEVNDQVNAFKNKLENMRISVLLSEEYDNSNAILKLNAGAGGTESCDWVSILYRMYIRWAESKGYKVKVLDSLDGDEAGLKSVTLQIDGENAYGYLKSERGVHRLVRISPFNAAGKRQTSFASLDVMPDIEEDVDIEINDDDIRIDTYRSSGAGGQHINKTSSAIRITHFPTGTVVQCQNERSQVQNKDKAMKMLKAKLLMIKREEEEAKRAGIRGEVKEIGWGSQIRSYVLQPYTMVKDHRTGEEIGNAQSVLDGNLDPFIGAYLKWNSLNKVKE